MTTPNVPGVGDGPTTDIIAILTAMYTAGVKTLTNGALAVIHAVDYSSASVSGIDINVSYKSTVSVDKNNVKWTTAPRCDIRGSGSHPSNR